MSSPTPGPWHGVKIPGLDHTAIVSTAKPRTRVALVPTSMSASPPTAELRWPTAEEAEANVRLIVAAPTMFKLLHEMLRGTGEPDSDEVMENHYQRTLAVVDFIEGIGPPSEQLQ